MEWLNKPEVVDEQLADFFWKIPVDDLCGSRNTVAFVPGCNRTNHSTINEHIPVVATNSIYIP